MSISPPNIAVLILNFNGDKDTIECLKSLEKCSYSSFEVFLIDNGSIPHTFKQSSLNYSFPIHFHRSEKNLGFAGGNNFLLKQISDSDRFSFIYFLNNDTVVDPLFLTEAIKTINTDSSIGVISSLSLQYYNHSLVENAGHLFLRSGDFIPRGRDKPKESFQKTEEIMGACSANALYRLKTLEECGFYDEKFFLNYEDVDLSIRCIVQGWKCIYSPKSIIYHKVNVSISKIRDYNFNVRSQFNSLKAYYHNTPLIVLLFNLPFVLIKFFGVVFGNLLFLRFRILKTFLHGYLLLIKDLPNILKQRKKVLSNRKISSWKIIKSQKGFLSVYLKYFKHIILCGNKCSYDK